jgi:hypothetical protein
MCPFALFAPLDSLGGSCKPASLPFHAAVPRAAGARFALHCTRCTHTVAWPAAHSKPGQRTCAPCSRRSRTTAERLVQAGPCHLQPSPTSQAPSHTAMQCCCQPAGGQLRRGAWGSRPASRRPRLLDALRAERPSWQSAWTSTLWASVSTQQTTGDGHANVMLSHTGAALVQRGRRAEHPLSTA